MPAPLPKLARLAIKVPSSEMLEVIFDGQNRNGSLNYCNVADRAGRKGNLPQTSGMKTMAASGEQKVCSPYLTEGTLLDFTLRRGSTLRRCLQLLLLLVEDGSSARQVGPVCGNFVHIDLVDFWLFRC
mmetsp:Transcript_114587/g.262969  ORF Transcript_114587/g.262969 Transcript_114587/m.262969 type:complete len:128 (-) Transcript_114587:202-585(-)